MSNVTNIQSRNIQNPISCASKTINEANHFIKKYRNDYDNLALPQDYRDKIVSAVDIIEIQTAREIFSRCYSDRANIKQAKFLFTMMIDWIPSAKNLKRDQLISYVEGIIIIIDDGICSETIPFSTDVIAAAIIELLRESEFQPAPSKVFAALQKARHSFRYAMQIADTLIEARRELDNRPPPPTPEEIEKAKIERIQLREELLAKRREFAENDRRRRQDEHEAAERARREREAALESECAQLHADADRRRSVMNDGGACPDREPEKTCRECLLRWECGQRRERVEPDHEIQQQIADAERRVKVIKETRACPDKEPATCKACLLGSDCFTGSKDDPFARPPRRPSRRP
jgi:hypothetical protein